MDAAFADRLGVIKPDNSKQSQEMEPSYQEITIKTNDEEPRRFVSVQKKEIEMFPIRAGTKAKKRMVTQEFTAEGLMGEGVQLESKAPPIIRADISEKIPRISPLKLELAWVTEGMVYNWINRIIEFFLSANPVIECGDKRDQKKIDKWVIKTGWRELLKLQFQHKYIYGNAVWRWIFDDNKKRVGLDFIDPKYFDAVRDKHGKVKLDTKGEPIGYVQYIKFEQSLEGIPEDRIITQDAPFDYQSGKGILYQPDEIIHFRLNRVGDAWWGVGQVEPIYSPIINKKNADVGFAESIQRTGYPRVVAYVGDKEHPPTSQKVDDVANELQDIQEESLLVLPFFTKLDMLESKNIGNVQPNLKYFRDGIVAGLGGPESLITGLGEATNRATLQDQKLWLERSLKMEQQDTADGIKQKVLIPLAKDLELSSVPTLVFHEVSMEPLDWKLDRIVKLVNVQLLNPEDIKIREYVRKLLDIPSILDGDKNVAVSEV